MAAEPKCPSCSVQGIEHIVSQQSTERSRQRDPWFVIVHCAGCGHVYGVFPKHVFTQGAPPRYVIARD